MTENNAHAELNEKLGGFLEDGTIIYKGDQIPPGAKVFFLSKTFENEKKKI